MRGTHHILDSQHWVQPGWDEEMRGTHCHHILDWAIGAVRGKVEQTRGLIISLAFTTGYRKWKGNERTLPLIDSHQCVQIKNSVSWLVITVFIIQVVCEVDGVASEPQLTGLSVEPATLRLREDGAHTKIRNTGKQEAIPLFSLVWLFLSLIQCILNIFNCSHKCKKQNFLFYGSFKNCKKNMRQDKCLFNLDCFCYPSILSARVV